VLPEGFVNAEPRRRSPDGDVPDAAISPESGDPLIIAARMDAIARLAGVVSHDFSNLLTVILGHADLLLDLSGANPSMRNSVLEIKNAAESGARVAGDLLAISQRQSLKPVPADMNARIRQAAETICQILGEQIDVRFDLAPELPLVEVDPAQYERVLRSIAVHARESMPQGGRLTIATTVEVLTDHAEVVMTAADTGSHISPRSAEPLFTGKKPSRGAGLALATAYGIIEQSGGALTVAQSAGRGATITVVMRARDAAIRPRT
jgi:signal transduction histidine kinase